MIGEREHKPPQSLSVLVCHSKQKSNTYNCQEWGGGNCQKHNKSAIGNMKWTTIPRSGVKTPNCDHNGKWKQSLWVPPHRETWSTQAQGFCPPLLLIWQHIHFSCYNYVIGLSATCWRTWSHSLQGTRLPSNIYWVIFCGLIESPGYESWLCHLLVEWPLASYLTFMKHSSRVLENNDYMR